MARPAVRPTTGKRQFTNGVTFGTEIPTVTPPPQKKEDTVKLSEKKFKIFVKNYIKTAMDACMIDQDENSPNFDIPFSEAKIDLSDEALAEVKNDCQAFVESAESAGIDLGSCDMEMAGHDFFRTRSCDELPFEEDPEEYYSSESTGKTLGEIAQSFEANYLFVNDGGKAYFKAQ